MDSSSSSEVFFFKSMEALPPMIPHRFSDEQNIHSTKQGLLRRPYSAKDAALISDVLTIEPIELKLMSSNLDQKDLEVLEAFRKVNEATKNDVYKNVIKDPFIIPCSSPVSDADIDEIEEKQIHERDLYKEREIEEELEQDFCDEDCEVIVPFSIKISTNSRMKEPKIEDVHYKCDLRKDQREHKHHTSSSNSSPLKLKVFNIPLVTKSQNFGSNSPEAFHNIRMPRPRIKRSKSAQNIHIPHVLSEKKRPVSAQPNVLNLFTSTTFKEHLFPVGKQTLQTLNYMNFLEKKQKDTKTESIPSRQQVKSTILQKENTFFFKSTRLKPSLTSVPDSKPKHEPGHKSVKEVTTENEINQKYRFSFRQSKNGYMHNINSSSKYSTNSIPNSGVNRSEKDEKMSDKKIVRPTSKIYKNSRKQQEEKAMETEIRRLTTKKSRRAQSAPCRRSVDKSEELDKSTKETKFYPPKNQSRKSSIPDSKARSTVTMISLLNSNEKPRRVIKNITYSRVQQTKNAKVTFGTFSDITQKKERTSTLDQKELEEYLQQRRESRECSVSKECLDLYTKLKDKNVQVSIDTLRRALMKPSEVN